MLGPLLGKQNIQAKEVHVPRWLYPGMDPEVRFKKKPLASRLRGLMSEISSSIQARLGR